MNSVSSEAVPEADSLSIVSTISQTERAALDAAFSVDAANVQTVQAELSTSSSEAQTSVRTSLRASTLDGVFAAIFGNVAGGVLLSNFLVELHATPLVIGLVASLPMLANLLQPLGARLSERTTSRRQYGLWVYSAARMLWFVLAIGIGLASWGKLPTHQLIDWVLAIGCLSYFLGALGIASWMSWMATIVPAKLRGRYFGFRNSAASLTMLLAVPLAGLVVSKWPGGSLEGYGVALIIAILAGLLSIGCQFLIRDVNPRQPQQALPTRQTISQKTISQNTSATLPRATSETSLWRDRNFMTFLAYFSLWMFGFHLSAPFFNIYLLEQLQLNLTWVTMYSSLMAAAHLIMMMEWGKVTDRIGNQPILLGVGVLVALTPVLWLGTQSGALSLWLGFPLLFLLQGATMAGMDLGNSNIQFELATTHRSSTYFAIAAAVSGLSGALGTTLGGWLMQFPSVGGFFGLFALSGVVRLVALLPLLLVEEPRSRIRFKRWRFV